MTRITAPLLAFVIAAPTLMAQPHQGPLPPRAPEDNPVTKEKAELGRYLFHSPLLSRNRLISCATCHDPEDGFTDGRPESRGIFETDVGRNSPTLWGVHMHPGFVGPLPKPGQKRNGKPARGKLLSLEERCLTPISNPVEMGSSVKQAVRAIKRVPDMRRRFDEAFDRRGYGVTGERIGKAIATYLRTVGLPDSSYKDFLNGKPEALSDAALRGLQVFTDRGRCADCHSGEYLSDGRLHIVSSPRDFRNIAQRAARVQRHQRLVQRRPSEAEAERGRSRHRLTPEKARKGQRIADVLKRSQEGQGYDTPTVLTLGSQTPTLWDVASTAPYFRDGSVSDLEVAVRQHMSEIRRRSRSTSRNCSSMAASTSGPDQLPRRLQPRYQAPSGQPKPELLSDDEVSDLLAFLRSLSPAPRSP